MKKLIAISVMLALIVGAVFAETQVSGAVETRMRLFGTGGAKDEKAKTWGDGIAEGYIQVSAQNDEGTMGAALRLKDNSYHKAFVWWKPIDQIKIFLGQDPDGMFGSDGLVSYNYYGSGTGYLSTHNWDLWRAFFPGNWDTFGLALSFYPTDGLEINLVVPTGVESNNNGTHTSYAWRLEDMYIGGIRVSASYAIADIGKIFFVYNGPNNIETGAIRWLTNYAGAWGSGGWDPLYSDTLDKYKTETKGQIAGSFLLTAVDGFQIQPGVSVVLANEDGPSGFKYNPTFIGLGVWYTADAFSVKLRGGYIMNERFNDKRSRLVLGVLPSFKISDSATAYADIYIDQTTVDGADKNPMIFGFNPSVKVNMGAGAFGIGVKIENNGQDGDDARTTVSVPMRFVFSF
jgi:hypothetical protein